MNTASSVRKTRYRLHPGMQSGYGMSSHEEARNRAMARMQQEAARLELEAHLHGEAHDGITHKMRILPAHSDASPWIAEESEMACEEIAEESEEVEACLGGESNDEGLYWADFSPTELSFLPALDTPGKTPKKWTALAV